MVTVRLPNSAEQAGTSGASGIPATFGKFSKFVLDLGAAWR
jgi:hypothetical protein